MALQFPPEVARRVVRKFRRRRDLPVKMRRVREDKMRGRGQDKSA